MKPPSILIFFLLVACSKKQTISIHAVDPTNNEPIENFEYYILSEYKSQGETFNETVAYGKTNFQGNGIANLKLKRGRTYTVHGIKPEGFCYINSTEFSLPNKKQNSNIQFEVYKCGTLKLKIDNIGCTGENDKMNYRIKSSLGGWSAWSNDYTGCYTSLYSQYISYPVGPLKVHWKVVKTGFSYEDSVTLNLNVYSPTSFHLQY